MFYWLVILFIGIPLLELVILIKVGALIGMLNTILLILVSGVLGAALARHQGLGIIIRIREEMAQGRVPPDELLNGICILAGGFLLLIPGLLTDVVGFALLIPPVRELMKKYLRYKFKRKRKIDIL